MSPLTTDAAWYGRNQLNTTGSTTPGHDIGLPRDQQPGREGERGPAGVDVGGGGDPCGSRGDGQAIDREAVALRGAEARFTDNASGMSSE